MEGVSPDQYLERFAWNEAKYPPRRPLSETVSAITETTQKLEDDLKARITQMMSCARLAGQCLNPCGCHAGADERVQPAEVAGHGRGAKANWLVGSARSYRARQAR